MVDLIEPHPRSQSLELATRSRKDDDNVNLIDSEEERIIPGIVVTNQVEQISAPKAESLAQQEIAIPVVAASAWGVHQQPPNL